MKLIAEVFEDTRTIIEEGKNKEKRLYIEGIFAQSEIVNKNKRIYPDSVLNKEVSRYIEEKVKTNRALGELNHPPRAEVDPAAASHRIVEMWKQGNNYYGKALILDTPNGKIVKGLLEGGTKLGVSTRGLGSLKPREDGINEVAEDYHLICVDIVADPSAPDAFVNGILEGAEWVWESGKPIKVIEDAKKRIEKTPSRRLNEEMLRIFEEILKA